ncbi:MAG TPA: shikimate dehydrogenase [Allosphingosinicella sp.]|nr:shikimate dehydrogenase [Allosphingosinicella sp.]
MAIPYAEVIGDPIEHSKSPLIHKFWLDKLGLEGDYRAARVSSHQLPAYLRSKRYDTCWRGCSVTAPLKQEAAGLVGVPPGLCDFLGAVNCITRTPLSCLIGTNTDLAGLAEALGDIDLAGGQVVLIGAGGAARAALCYLVRQGARRVTIICRDESKGEQLGRMMRGGTEVRSAGFDRAAGAIATANLVINATPMGMAGQPEIYPQIVDGLDGQSVFDMVYAPVETQLVAAARAKGGKAIDGLAMLIGQAAPAFELFFGERPPRQHDGELRVRLAA